MALSAARLLVDNLHYGPPVDVDLSGLAPDTLQTAVERVVVAGGVSSSSLALLCALEGATAYPIRAATKALGSRRRTRCPVLS